ncbi:diphthine--ammonia ligase [Planococcus dechangensis]|uniref:Diphthine--ammonia ligase n=1 Tax=Planococcus dechangensis TaxID=1176255 RepID=A0ABV9M7G0_9BACL
MQKPFITSWSGGKDSALAFYRAVKQGHVPIALFTMFEEGGERSKSHGLKKQILEAQAERMGLPLVIGEADWAGYEEEFIHHLKNFKAQGIELGVYGDIDLEDHRLWVEKVSKQAELDVLHPLWQEMRRSLLTELVDEEFKAVITVVDTSRVGEEFLGRVFTHELIVELEALGIDACGEEGEFHTTLVDGPIFVEPLPVEFGNIERNGQYAMLEVKLQPGE